MISPVEENVTTDNIKKLAQIRDEFRGRYYTIEEMSNMSGVPVDQLKTLVNARRSTPFWNQVYIQKSQRVQIEKAGGLVTYYCPYSASIPASSAPNYLDGSSRECSFARTLFTNGGHPRHGKIYDPVCIVFQLLFFSK